MDTKFVHDYIPRGTHDSTIDEESLSLRVDWVAVWNDGKAILTEENQVFFIPESAPAFFDFEEPSWSDVVEGKTSWGKPFDYRRLTGNKL